MNKYIDALNIAIENAKRNIPAFELNEVLEKNLKPIGIGWYNFSNHLKAHDNIDATKLVNKLTQTDVIIENIDKIWVDWFYPSIQNYVFIDDGISESHEQYHHVWNQMRRSKRRNSIELKLQNKYILDIGIARTEMYLIRIQDETHIYPMLYFSKDKDSKIGTNIGILKIYSQIKDADV